MAANPSFCNLHKHEHSKLYNSTSHNESGNYVRPLALLDLAWTQLRTETKTINIAKLMAFKMKKILFQWSEHWLHWTNQDTWKMKNGFCSLSKHFFWYVPCILDVSSLYTAREQEESHHRYVNWFDGKLTVQAFVQGLFEIKETK